MILAGAAQVAGSDGEAAAAEAARRALARAGTLHARAAVLLVTAEAAEHVEAIAHTARRHARAEHVVGATVGGTLTADGEIEDGPAVAALVLGGDVRAEPFLIPCADRAAEAGAELARRIGAGPPASLVLLWADPIGLDPEALLAALDRDAPGVPVAGGGCAVGPGGAAQFLDGQVARGAVVGLIVRAASPAQVALSHACRPVSEPMPITAARDNVVLTLGGRPALAVLAEIARATPGLEDLHRAAGLLTVGLVTDDASGYTTRPLMGFLPDEGGLAIGAPVAAGGRLLFAVREALGARNDLRARLRAGVRALGGAPAFGVYFNCMGRGSNLYGASHVDRTLIRQALGDAPFVGGFTSFEIARTGREARVHMFTGVMALAAGSV